MSVKDWRDFDRKMLLARLRWNLLNLCPTITVRMRLEKVPVDTDTLAHYLVLEVANIRPRSAVVPWHLDDEVVEKMAQKVARDFAAVGRTVA